MQTQGAHGENAPGHGQWIRPQQTSNKHIPGPIAAQPYDPSVQPPPGAVPPGIRPPMPFQARPPQPMPPFAVQAGYRPPISPVYPYPSNESSLAASSAPVAGNSLPSYPAAPVDSLTPQMANMNIQTTSTYKPGRSKRVYAPSGDIPSQIQQQQQQQQPVYPNTQSTAHIPPPPGVQPSTGMPYSAPLAPHQPQAPLPHPVPKSKIDPNQIPSPVSLQRKDQEVYSHQLYGTCSQEMQFPLSTTDFRAVDQGNCNPRFMRCTFREVPQAHDLVRDSDLPFGVIVQPLAKLHKDDDPVPVIPCRLDGPIRCRRCHGYLNCWCNFVDGGRKYMCNLCGFDNEVPEDYFSPVDMTGRRMDMDQRPELRYGTVELEVPQEYWARDPCPLHLVFAVDVSWTASKSGVLSTFCTTLKNLLPTLPESVKIGILTFDKTVCFYNLKPTLEQAQMMVVSDVNDLFLPLFEGFLVDPRESRSLIEDLLDNLPKLFEENKTPSAVFGAAVKGALLSLEMTGGKLHVLQASLPTVGPGALKNREDAKLYGSDKENKLLVPQDDVYPSLARDCIRHGVSVDLWLFPQNAYVDASTLGTLSEMTGGEMHYYYNFDKTRSSLQFAKELGYSLQREQGYDAALRLRCSNGKCLTIDNQYGNFHMTNSTDVTLAGIDADKSVGFTLDHDSKLPDGSLAYFQCALLYTTHTGQRRVRLHNLCLPVTGTIPSLFRQADLDTALNLIAKKMISQSTKVSLPQLASDLEKQCVSILAAYRKYCAADAPAGQLILPESFKLLPLYTLAVKKSAVLRKDVSINADNRIYHLRKLKAAGTAHTMRWLYPRMVPVHEMEGQDVIPMERLSYLRLQPTGLYLIANTNNADSYHTTFIWIGQQISSDLLERIFGVSQLDQVDPRMIELPSLDNPLSQRLHSMTKSPTITLVRQGLDVESEFAKTLVEDETYGHMSYVDYLCLVHKQIQNELEKEKRDTLMASASIWAQREGHYEDVDSKDPSYYPKEHEIEHYHLSTRPYEISEVTIVRKTTLNYQTQEIDISEDEDDEMDDMEDMEDKPRSFLDRLVAIPLIHDGMWSAQRLMRQYAIGRVVADQTEFAVRTVSPYVENSVANRWGNRSLDFVEQRFPVVYTPTEQVKNKMDDALRQARCAPREASKKALSVLDRHLLSDDRKFLQRIMSNPCSSQETLEHWMARIRSIKSRLPKRMQYLLGPLLKAAQQEYELLRSEFQQKHTPMEHARNIIYLQKELIVIPMWQSVSGWIHGDESKKEEATSSN